MPKQQGPMFVLKQLALTVKAARQEAERWQDLEAHCHDAESRRQISERREECDGVHNAALDYLIEQMDAFERTQDAWALRALKAEPSYAGLKVRSVNEKTPYLPNNPGPTG